MATASDDRRAARNEHRVVRNSACDGQPDSGGRSGHREKNAHYDGNYYTHKERRNLGRSGYERAEFGYKEDKRISDVNSAETQNERAERNDENIELSLSGVKRYDFHAQKRHDVSPYRIAGHTHRYGEASARNLIRPRADEPRNGSRKHREFFRSQRVSDSHAYSEAHRSFCDVRYGIYDVSERVIAYPTRNQRENSACDERAEKPLSHARERVDKPARRKFFYGFFKRLFFVFVANVFHVSVLCFVF